MKNKMFNIKKIGSLLALSFSLLSLFSCITEVESSNSLDSSLSTSSSSEKKTHKDFTFKLNEDQKSYKVILKPTSEEENLIIPSEYDGLPVTSLGGFNDNYTFKSIELPFTITSLPSGAFGGSMMLETINLDYVTSLGSGAFSNCDSLKSVVLNDQLEVIEDHTFYHCISLTEVKLPKNLKSIGKSAFYDCRKLENIIFPDGLTTIKEQAFELCTSLKAINLVDTLTFLGDYAFYYCSSARTLTLSSSLNEIPNFCFQNCKNIVDVEFPESIKKLKYYSFENCINLSSITIHAKDIHFGGHIFSKDKNLLNVYYSGTKEEFLEAASHFDGAWHIETSMFNVLCNNDEGLIHKGNGQFDSFDA